MKILSVNVGEPRAVPHGDGVVQTAIFKQPRAGRVRIRDGHLDGDRQADRQDHGGEHKAVYAYPHEHYAAWRAELGRGALEDAQFGENLTITGLVEVDAGIGDVLAIGSSVLRVTQPRKPCFKLGLRLGDATFPKRFLASGRLGFYLRVVEEGDLGAGDAIVRRERGPYGLSVADVWRIVFVDKDDRDGARRVLEIPWLAGEFRRPLVKRLEPGS